MLHLMLCALAAPDFVADAQAAGAAYDAVKSKTENAVTAGDLAAAQKLFLEVVPEPQRTAAHWFILGNLWFDMDPAFAMRMHEKAFAMAPEEPMVVREWALELHRAGKHAQAEPLYAKLCTAEGDEKELAHALRADCLLALGRHADAAAEWAEARKDKKAHVLHAFAWVYGTENQIAKRARILGELSANKVDNAEELVLGDVFWHPEDDRYFLKYEYMMNDMPMALAKLGKDSPRAQDLEAIVGYLFIDWEQQFPRSEGNVPRKELEESARKRGWLGDAPHLPVDDRVAAHMVEALRDQGLRTPEQLLVDFGADLEKRASSPTAPPEVAQTLIKLARKAKSPKLDEYQKLAKPEPKVAAAKAVDEARAAQKPLTELLAAQIRAEFKSKKPDASKLDKAFAALATGSSK